MAGHSLGPRATESGDATEMHPKMKRNLIPGLALLLTGFLAGGYFGEDLAYRRAALYVSNARRSDAMFHAQLYRLLTSGDRARFDEDYKFFVKQAASTMNYNAATKERRDAYVEGVVQNIRESEYDEDTVFTSYGPILLNNTGNPTKHATP